jgi:hypothetical protein
MCGGVSYSTLKLHGSVSEVGGFVVSACLPAFPKSFHKITATAAAVSAVIVVVVVVVVVEGYAMR